MSPSLEIRFAGQRLELDADGALYSREGRWLIVSDLHLEKASFLAQFGSPLPRYDTLHTLELLRALIARYRPEQIICLGDSFHDAKAPGRLAVAHRELLHDLMGSVAQWHWVLGNHDPVLDDDLPGARHASLELEGIRLLHEPEEGESAQIVGHFHPKMTVRLHGQRVSGKSFIHDEKLLIMPAFGSFTGGLDVGHEAISGLFDRPACYLTYRGRIWKMR